MTQPKPESGTEEASLFACGSHAARSKRGVTMTSAVEYALGELDDLERYGNAKSVHIRPLLEALIDTPSPALPPPASEADEPRHKKFRRLALERAASMDGSDFAGDLEAPDEDTAAGLARTVAIVLAAYDWTVDSDGRLFGLVAGDQGYAATSIVVDLPLAAPPQVEPDKRGTRCAHGILWPWQCQECDLSAELLSLRRKVEETESERDALKSRFDLELDAYAKDADLAEAIARAEKAERLAEERGKALEFADQHAAKIEALLEPHIKWECASEGCGRPATIHFERGGVGSYYCHECYMRIQAIPARALREGKP